MGGQRICVRNLMVKHFPCFFCFLCLFKSWIQASELLPPANDMAFQVGQMSVSQYIYLKEHEKEFPGETASISDSKVVEWLENWINRLKIVNKAAEEGYMHKPDVLNAVALMSRYMLIHGKNSPYARKVLEPLIFSEKRSGDDTIPHHINRQRKLVEIKRQIEHQLTVEMDSIGALFVLGNIEALLKSDRDPVLEAEIKKALFDHSFGNSPSQTTSIEKFFSKYNNKIVRSPIYDLKGLRSEITNLLVEEQLLSQALKMELNKDELFKLELENYLHKVVFETYRKREIERPTEEEVREFFLANQGKYKRAGSVAIWIAESQDFSFLLSLRKSLLKMKMKVLESNPERFIVELGKKAKTLGFEPRVVDQNFQIRSSEPSSNIFVAQIGWMPPIDRLNGVYRLIVKRGNVGEKISSFEISREAIGKDILNRKYEIRRQKDLLSVENKYKVAFGEGF